MCGSTVNYARQKTGTTTENLIFECDKSFRGAPANLHQQNPHMTSGIIFLTISYCTIYTIYCIRNSFGKGALKICSKFTGEHPCQSAISIKLLCNFIEIALRYGCSLVNLLHIFRTTFLKSTSSASVLT